MVVVRMVASAKRRRGRGMVVVEVMAAQIAAGVRMRSRSAVRRMARR